MQLKKRAYALCSKNMHAYCHNPSDHRVMSVTDGHQSYQPSATFDRFRA